MAANVGTSVGALSVRLVDRDENALVRTLDECQDGVRYADARCHGDALPRVIDGRGVAGSVGRYVAITGESAGEELFNQGRRVG